MEWQMLWCINSSRVNFGNTELRSHGVTSSHFSSLFQIKRWKKTFRFSSYLFVYQYYWNIFWDKYFMEKQKLICFLFSRSLFVFESLSFISSQYDLGVCYWKVCFSLNFQWNVIIRDFRFVFSRDVQIKGVLFKCGRLFHSLIFFFFFFLCQSESKFDFNNVIKVTFSFIQVKTAPFWKRSRT